MLRKLRSYAIHVSMVIILGALVVDTMIVSLSLSIGSVGSRNQSLAIFAIMIVVLGVGGSSILRFARLHSAGKNRGSGERVYSHLAYKVTTVILYALVGILVVILLEILLASSYHILLLKVAVLTSYGLSLCLLGFLAKRFLSWYASNRNWVVMGYTVAILTIMINIVSVLAFIGSELRDDPELITFIKSLPGAYSSSYGTYSLLYSITSSISFICTWFATVFLLKHYSEKLGRIKYWIVVSVPLAYFLSQFQPLFLYTFSEFRLSDPVLFGVIYTLVFSVSKPLGAVLFGTAFWLVARSLNERTVRSYMIISAYGMMLLFTANQPIGLVLVPYPPFGLATVCFVGLASYLIFLGIYSSAISVSEDSNLRIMIRRLALRESNFLEAIGNAEMQKEIERRVLLVSERAKKEMLYETGINPSLENEDIQRYLQEAIREIRGTDKSE